jgi:hypothetical protein
MMTVSPAYRVEAGDFVGVVEAGVSHGGARHHHGVEGGDGRGGPRAANAEHDVFDDGGASSAGYLWPQRLWGPYRLRRAPERRGH